MTTDETDNEAELQTAERTKKSRLKHITALVAALLLLSVAGNVYTIYRYVNQRTYILELEQYKASYSVNYYYFDSLTVDSFKKKVESSEEFIVLLTQSNCARCERMEVPFIRLAIEKGISDKIYHLNLLRLRQNEDAWTLFTETYGFEGTPTYARFAGGRLISNVGWSEKESIEFETVERWIEEQSDFFGT